MFRRLPEADAPMVAVTIDGRTERVRGGDTVAAALFSVGIETSRAADVSGAPRAPYCMMGVCFECLITIDGVGNRQGCLVPVAAGMRIETQRGKREVGR
jgi:sarcosine oxidase subunit alpha